MRRARNLDLLPVEPEPERTFRILRGIQRNEWEAMAEQDARAANEDNQKKAIETT